MTAKRRRATRGSGEQLRVEIVEATKKLLADAARADDVSIRAVADAVGVTPPSIYLHFADKNELLGAVVAAVFQELDEAMVGGAAGIAAPLERLRSFGLSYVRFAVAHPEHYRLATMDPFPTPNQDIDDVLRSAAFDHFRQTVTECIAAGLFAGDELAITFDLWAAAHGAASLMIAKPYLPWGGVDEFADRVLCAAATGHVVAARAGGQLAPDALVAWLASQPS